MIISPTVAYRQVGDGPNTARLACPACYDGGYGPLAPLAGTWVPVFGWEVECPGDHGPDSDCYCGEPARCDYCDGEVAR